MTKPGTQPNTPKAPKSGRSAAALFKNHGLSGKSATSVPPTSKLEEPLNTTCTEVVIANTQGVTAIIHISGNSKQEEPINATCTEVVIDNTQVVTADNMCMEEVEDSIKDLDAKMFGADTKCNDALAAETIKVFKVVETEVLEPATPACELSRNTSFLPVARHNSGDVSTVVAPGIQTADPATSENKEAVPAPSSNIPLGCWVVGLARVGVAANAAVAITCGYVGFKVSVYAGSSLCKTVLGRIWGRGR